MKRLSDGIAMMVENALLKTGNHCRRYCILERKKRNHDFSIYIREGQLAIVRQ